jgi:outer membrane protein assembly factor BamD (BamD/ComL family)
MENKMKDNISNIYSKAMKKLETKEYTEAVTTLIDMYKLDPSYNDEEAKKMILQVVNEHIIPNGVDSIAQL